MAKIVEERSAAYSSIDWWRCGTTRPDTTPGWGGSRVSPTLVAASPVRGLRRHGESPASDSNARAMHVDRVPPGSRTPPDHPPERRARGQFGLEAPSRSLFLSFHAEVGSRSFHSDLGIASLLIVRRSSQETNDFETPHQWVPFQSGPMMRFWRAVSTTSFVTTWI